MIALLFFLMWTYYSYEAFAAASRRDPWLTAEWLISWPAGFQRRGFIGEVILNLAEVLYIDATILVSVFQSLFFGVFLVGLGKLLGRFSSKKALVLLTLPTGLIVYIYDLGYVGRKEVILFAVGVWWMLYKLKCSKPHVVNEFMFFLLFLATFLSHEGLAFFSPMLAMSFLSKSKSPREIVSSILPVIASAIGLFVLTIGVPPSALENCKRLMGLGYGEDICSGAVSWLDRDVASVFRVVSGELVGKPASFLYLAALIWAIVTISVTSREYFAGSSSARNSILISAMLFSTPIFLLSLDWGRWIHILTILTTISMVASDHQPKPMELPTKTAVDTRSISGWLISFAMFQVFLLGVSHYGGNFVNVLVAGLTWWHQRFG